MSGKTPTHHPVYLGTNPDEAVCGRHGEMEFRTPILKKGGNIFAALDGVKLYECPECCLDILAKAGEPGASPERAMKMILIQFIKDDWETHLRKLFVDLGSGEMDEGPDGRRGVFFHEDPEKGKIPDYLLERGDWFVHSRGNDE